MRRANRKSLAGFHFVTDLAKYLVFQFLPNASISTPFECKSLITLQNLPDLLVLFGDQHFQHTFDRDLTSRSSKL